MERPLVGGVRVISEDTRPMFAHLKLQADSIGANAMDSSPTIKAFGCAVRTTTAAQLAAANVAAAAVIAARC